MKTSQQLLIALLAFLSVLLAQEQQHVLTAGAVVNGELGPGHEHSYPLDLEAGMFISASLDRRGIGIDLVLEDPRG